MSKNGAHPGLGKSSRRCVRVFAPIIIGWGAAFGEIGALYAAEPAPLPVISGSASTVSETHTAASEPADSAQKTGSDLTAAEVNQVITQIKANYFRPGELSQDELQKALLAGILTRISPGASLVSTDQPGIPASQPFKMEILKDTVGYLRLGSISNANLAELDTALKSFEGRSITGLVLDLRATPVSNDFPLAAEIIARFCAPTEPFFSTKTAAFPGSKRPKVPNPPFQGPLMVLIDSDNAGASEIIAEVLRAKAKAILIGAKTKGEGVEFKEFPVGSKAILRVAVSEVVVPGGAAIYPEGLKPDLPVQMDPETRRKLLAIQVEKGVAPTVLETERPRSNEASLVAKTNPEMDAYQEAQKTGSDKSKSAEPAIRDTVLQRALDLIATIGVYGTRVK